MLHRSAMVGSPVNRLARLAIARPLEKAGLVCVLAATAAASAAALLLLLLLLRLGCPASPKKLWSPSAVVEECDFFDGKWVWDDNYPLYESKDCPFVDAGFRCSENGRPDTAYTKWRWQPSRCDLPRFDAKSMLERLRNKRVVFAGDSIGRNQWESLLCMLSAGVSDKSSIYEVNGNPITKHMGFLIFKFGDYNCTVEYYRSPFLVPQGRAPAGAPKAATSTVRVDVMDWMSDRRRGKWGEADLLIFNSGHWWTYEKTIGSGSYFQEGDEVKMDMTVDDAYGRSIRTLFDWLQKEVDTSKTQTIFRTYAPRHFSGGGWNSGGRCQLETLPYVTLKSVEQWADMLKPVNDVLGNDKRPKLPGLDILNVTQMTAQRKDGHLSVFSSPLRQDQNVLLNGTSEIQRLEDCSHWCLPGIPDTWNELLYAVFMRRHMMLDQNVSLSG